MGRKLVEFTLAELAAVKALADKITAHFSAPKPPARGPSSAMYSGRWNLHGDAAVRPSPVPDERLIDVDAFPPDVPLMPADEEAMYQHWLARRRVTAA